MSAPADRAEAGGLIDFIDAAPSPYHACARAAWLLEAAGFDHLEEAAAWPAAGRHYLVRGGTLIAWSVPERWRPGAGFRLLGAHTDSPNLRIRPRPDLSAQGLRQLAVEVYGRPLLNSWMDRDLGISGRVVVSTGAGLELRLVRIDRPLLRIPQLAPHLSPELKHEGLRINPQTQLVPVWALEGPGAPSFSCFLAEQLEVVPERVLGWELMTHDLVPGALTGLRGEFVSTARLDNLGSCYAVTRTMVEWSGGDRDGGRVAVAALFDHEEVGSQSATGAESELLPRVLERVVLARGGSRDDYLRGLADTTCLSCDMAHAAHPNYPERSEPGHPVRMGGGPAIKLNARLRYATDAPAAAAFAAAAQRAGVPWQSYVARGDLPCGTTIGPITAARLGIETVDVGIPQLAMHSARELCGADDPGYLVRAMTEFLSG